MKKLLLGGIAALAVVVATERPASAWINSKFSVGLNWHWQSGGNNLLWGLFRNGQPPGPEAYGGGYNGGHPGFNVAPFPYFGGGPNGGPNGGPGSYGSYGTENSAPTTMPTAPPPSSDAGPARNAVAQFYPAVWHTPAAYQPVSYSSPYYPQYVYPQYGYPQSTYPQYGYPVEGAYGTWGAPQYWGR